MRVQLTKVFYFEAAQTLPKVPKFVRPLIAGTAAASTGISLTTAAPHAAGGS